MPITQNKKGGKAVVVATADETLAPTAFNIGDEVTTGLNITGVYWSAPTGSIIEVTTGTNTVFNLSGSGSWNLYENNISIDLGTAGVALTVPTGGTVIVELRKESTFESQYYGR